MANLSENLLSLTTKLMGMCFNPPARMAPEHQEKHKAEDSDSSEDTLDVVENDSPTFCLLYVISLSTEHVTTSQSVSDVIVLKSRIKPSIVECRFMSGGRGTEVVMDWLSVLRGVHLLHQKGL